LKLTIKNNAKAPYGVEKVGGGYVFIPPGEERIVEAANPDAMYSRSFLDVCAVDYKAGPIPAKLAQQAAALDHDENGEAGGSKPAADRGLDALRAQATELGVTVDRRWGPTRLTAEIAKASK
jgi:hypothetical protein